MPDATADARAPHVLPFRRRIWPPPPGTFRRAWLLDHILDPRD